MTSWLLPSDWHLTWQDPVAIGLVIAGVALAWWFHRRTPTESGCHGCPVATIAHGAQPPSKVGLGTTRLGHRR